MSRPFSPIRPPDRSDIAAYAERAGLELTEAEEQAFTELIGDKLGVLDLLDDLAEEHTPSRSYTDRDPGSRPSTEEDPLNAYVRTCRVEGAEDGPLAGRTVGVKDNIPVAGIEMTMGTRAFEGFTPSFDAEAVTRLLDAGATVKSKTNLDEFAISGSGELGFGGPIRNPHDPDRLAGGSSGGSAIAVVEEDVDIALGTDQAGSIRTPAAWCGCVGIKPTFGLVPYTGCVPGGPTYDHVGPMARSTRDCAAALDVLAGPDDQDPRQPSETDSTGYLAALEEGVEDLKIGRLEEGFGLEDSDPAVDEAVREATDTLGDLAAGVKDVSVDWHRQGILVWLGVGWTENAALLRDNGQGYYRRGPYYLEYLSAFAKAKATMSDILAPTVKLKLLMGEYLREAHQGRYHAIAQNLREPLTEAYDRALESVDILALPTTPTTAFAYESGLTLKETVRRAQGKEGRTTNTMPFNMTGHPAISVPCGTDEEGLPIGMMLVGRHGEDEAVLRAAHAFETTNS